MLRWLVTWHEKFFNENDKNLIRENLIEFGLEALESNGYKATSVEKIANHAGIAKGTFYNFFQSKEQFLFERYANKKNVYHYFTYDEFNIIFRKITERLSLTNIDSINYWKVYSM